MKKLSCTFQIAHNPVGQLLLCCKQMELETLRGETGVVLEVASVGRTPPSNCLRVLQFLWYFGKIWAKVLSCMRGGSANLGLRFQAPHGRTGEFH